MSQPMSQSPSTPTFASSEPACLGYNLTGFQPLEIRIMPSRAQRIPALGM